MGEKDKEGKKRGKEGIGVEYWKDLKRGRKWKRGKFILARERKNMGGVRRGTAVCRSLP